MCDTLFAGIRPIPSIPSQTRSLPSIRPSELPMRRSRPRNHPSIRPVGRYRARFDASEKPSVDPCRNPPQGARAPSVDPIASQLRSVPPNCRCADPCRETIRRSVPSVDTGHIDARRGSRPVFTSIPFRECRCAHACRPRMRLRFPKMMSRSFQPRNVALRSNVRHAFRGNPSDSFDSVPDSIPAVDPPPNCRCADPVRETIRRSLPKSPTGRAAPSVDPIASQLRSVPPNCRCVDPCRETIRRSVPSVDTGRASMRPRNHPSIPAEIPHRARGAVGRSDCVPASIRPSELPMRRSLPRNHPSIRPVGRYRSHRCAARFPSRIHVDPLPRMPMRPCLPSENAPFASPR